LCPLQKNRIQHRHTKDAQRVRALMNGSYEANDDDCNDDEDSLASPADNVASVPTLASSGASMSSTSSSRGTIEEEEADEQSMLAY